MKGLRFDVLVRVDSRLCIEPCNKLHVAGKTSIMAPTITVYYNGVVVEMGLQQRTAGGLAAFTSAQDELVQTQLVADQHVGKFPQKIAQCVVRLHRVRDRLFDQRADSGASKNLLCCRVNRGINLWSGEVEREFSRAKSTLNAVKSRTSVEHVKKSCWL